MAQRHPTFNVTIPAGTTQAAGVEAPTIIDPGIVKQCRIVTPGVLNTGCALAVAHQIVIPLAGTQWIASTNVSQSYTFAMDDYPESGQWGLYGYNTTTADVTYLVHFDVDELPLRPRATPRLFAPIPASEISAARDVAAAVSEILHPVRS